jgi:hypothetical protein
MCANYIRPRMSRTLLKLGDGPGASYAAVVTVTSSV